MTLATRVSLAFLVALAVALGGLSLVLYSAAAFRLRLALDQELEAVLDGFPQGPGGQGGRVTWALYDDAGRRADDAPADLGPAVLDGRDLGPLAVDRATTVPGAGGYRWRVLVRRAGPGPRAGPHDPRGKDHRPEPPGGHKGRGSGRDRQTCLLAAWAAQEPVETDIRWLGAALPLTSLALWGLAAAAGRHFARRALRPLARLAAAARSLPADGGRLPSPGTGDELEAFAGSFNGLLDRVRVAHERQRQFAGQASHQLRTPLAGLIAAIDVARRRPRSAESLEDVLDRVRGDADRLWRVIESLLFLARSEADAGLPDLERVELGGWAAAHLSAWGEHPRAADLRVEVPAGGPLWVRAHRALLGQLLDNLLDNACKYSDPGAPVVVTVREGGGAAELAVADRGRGIPPEELPRVFEPFYRAEDAGRAGPAGVGLGLSVARRVAEAHGGSLAAESGPGRGSRFVFRLPPAPRPA